MSLFIFFMVEENILNFILATSKCVSWLGHFYIIALKTFLAMVNLLYVSNLDYVTCL
jgi:hypothetical protein